MVLYGYDASTFNSVQGSDNWLEWFNLTSESTYMLGLINTVYSIGAIVSGWFIGGPVVSSSLVMIYVLSQRLWLEYTTNHQMSGRLFRTSSGYGSWLLCHHLRYHVADLRPQG